LADSKSKWKEAQSLVASGRIN